MRLKLDIISEEDFSYQDINKHMIQGMIYSYLWDTEYEKMHEEKKFKFFSFSDIFPPTDFKKGEEKNLIISSPNKKFIEVLYQKMKDENYIYFGNKGFMIKKFIFFPEQSSSFLSFQACLQGPVTIPLVGKDIHLLDRWKSSPIYRHLTLSITPLDTLKSATSFNPSGKSLISGEARKL